MEILEHYASLNTVRRSSKSYATKFLLSHPRKTKHWIAHEKRPKNEAADAKSVQSKPTTPKMCLEQEKYD